MYISNQCPLPGVINCIVLYCIVLFLSADVEITLQLNTRTMRAKCGQRENASRKKTSIMATCNIVQLASMCPHYTLHDSRLVGVSFVRKFAKTPQDRSEPLIVGHPPPHAGFVLEEFSDFLS
jgi:hypothetical protein